MIYQKCPDSAFFQLPALANLDVQNWMKHEFPTSLTLLMANEGSSVDLQCIQNQELWQSFEELRSLLASQTTELMKLHQILSTVLLYCPQ